MQGRACVLLTTCMMRMGIHWYAAAASCLNFTLKNSTNMGLTAYISMMNSQKILRLSRWSARTLGQRGWSMSVTVMLTDVRAWQKRLCPKCCTKECCRWIWQICGVLTDIRMHIQSMSRCCRALSGLGWKWTRSP